MTLSQVYERVRKMIADLESIRGEYDWTDDPDLGETPERDLISAQNSLENFLEDQGVDIE